MVGMAQYTNMPMDISSIAMQLENDILTGKFKPFGDTPEGDLAVMMNYVDGIDATVPN